MAAILVYYGVFNVIKPKLINFDRELMVYKDLKGSYKESGVVSDEVYLELKNSFSADTYRGVGLYYDNPQEVPTDQLRSEIGCILENKDLIKVDKIKSKLKIREIEGGSSPTVEFPYRGRISVIIGVLKIYPVINRYKKENSEFKDSPILEIWDVPNKKIIYRIL